MSNPLTKDEVRQLFLMLKRQIFEQNKVQFSISYVGGIASQILREKVEQELRLKLQGLTLSSISSIVKEAAEIAAEESKDNTKDAAQGNEQAKTKSKRLNPKVLN